MRKLHSLIALFLVACGACQQLPNSRLAEAKKLAGVTTEGHGGAVVSASGVASEAGRDVMLRGGNAVDGAVATAFALAVTWPEAGNIGGGGFMVIHPPAGSRGKPVVIDYREAAPAAATAGMFAVPGGRTQPRLVGVPGTVRGLALARERYGRLAWKELLAPAIKLAEEGFAIDASLAGSLNSGLRGGGEEAAEMRRVLGKSSGGAWAAGDRLVQQELGATLRLIAEGGPDAFYKGAIAESLVSTLKSSPTGGGIMTAADLAAYTAKVREPVHGRFRGYDIYAPPPPSSGGICLVEMLNVLERYELKQKGRWSPDTLHLMVETMRLAYLDRAKYLGDPDFVTIPAFLTTKEHAAQVAGKINPQRAGVSDPAAAGTVNEEGPQTTHFSVIDGEGMAVSNTYTLEQSFGGKIMVKGRGFLLNNEMGDFNPQPGVTNRSGQIGTAANVAAPGKRMLSSMTPVVVTKNGKVVLVTGSPGGRTIINTVLCVVLNRLEFEMSPRESVDAPRMSHQWLPDTVSMEGALQREHGDAVAAVRERGQQVGAGGGVQGDAHSIFVEGDLVVGVADRRRGGGAAGWEVGK